MTLVSRSTWRTALTIGLGLALIALLLSALTAAPATARPDSSTLDQILAAQSLQPNAPLAIPKLPIGFGPPSVNDDCSDLGYAQGITVTFVDQSGATGIVHLLHDSNSLYVCMIGAKGTNNERFASVYLDTDDGRETFAEADDYALRIGLVTGTLSSLHGTGVANGYTPIALGGWTAARAVGSEIAEYQIGLSLTGGACGNPFGLAVFHQLVTALNDSYGWPAGSIYDSPQTWQEVALAQQTCGNGKIAYVYRSDTFTAGNFKTLLEGAGYTVQLIPQSSVTTTNFSVFDLTIIADDTGELNQWGLPAVSVTPVVTTHKPIIGLGEGGYSFFGKAGSPIGWPNGWHGPQDKVLDSGIVFNYYRVPNNLGGLLPGPFPIYSALVNEVGIYMNTAPASVIPIGWEPPSVPQGNPDHASLTLDGCYHLWGFSNGPQDMNGSGKNLFLNAVSYMITFQCPAPPPPPPQPCVQVSKTANPAAPGPVQPGDVIKYTIVYTVFDNQQCTTQNATLIDPVPIGTQFVPGSSSGGVTPNIEDTLIWPLGNLAAGHIGSQSFSVFVLDTPCNDQQVVNNRARLQGSTGAFDSNTVTHQVTCPPVIPPNEEPPYAEEEVEIYPYPLRTGVSTHVSARVRSLSATTQTVTVTFQTSPDRFGIGLAFAAIPAPGNPRVVVLPPFATVEVGIDWTPISSGHYCIQVKIEGAGFAPVYTQRNLDVTEDLRPGVTDNLTFTVGNPTAAVANIDLVVDNTCPGWTASVTPTILLSVAPGLTRTAVLRVTPPTIGPPLGSGCHIDVQGWIGDRLIGGIRKLDVPPVNLPPGNPPWEEREISTIPTVPVSGTVNQLCVELQNPWPVTRVVTVTFSEADFGAGVSFTPRATQVFTLPPNSLNKYCINWTPLAGGTLHRCLLVTLQQPGFRDQISQRNIDLVRRSAAWNPGTAAIPFVIGNPNQYQSEVDLNGILIGLNNWMPQFDPPAPYFLGPGETRNVMLHLVPAMQRHAPQADPPATLAGDLVQVDVSMILDGKPYSGFSVDFLPPLNVYLPLILK